MFYRQSLLLVISCLLHGAVGAKTVKALLVSNRHEILHLEVDNTTSGPPEVVVSSDTPIVAFDVHQAWKQIFWATDYCIYRTPMYDLQTTVQIASTGKVGDLAVDWTHHQVYWSDTIDGRIEAAHLDGRGRRVVLETEWPASSLVVDPQIGKLIWMECSQVGSRMKWIKSSSLDGSKIKNLYKSTNIYEFSPLAIDVIYKSVSFYQKDGSLSKLWKVKYSGEMPAHKVFEKKEPVPSSLVITDEGFYSSNSEGLSFGLWKYKSVLVVYGSNKRILPIRRPYFTTTVANNLTEFSGMRVMEGTQPTWKDECQFHRCQHECVASGVAGPTCTCAYGFTLDHDHQACTENGYLLFTTKKTIGRTTLDGDAVMTLYNDSSSNIQSLDVHVKSGYLYWSDLNKNAIYRAPADSPNRKQAVVVDTSAYGVAIDWLYGHIYWSDHSRIMISNLDGTNPMAILEDVDAPADIVVDPIKRYIFWAECGHSFSLNRAGLSGDNLTALVRHVTCGISLLADPNNETLYWLDWAGDLFSCEYDCTLKKSLHTGMARAVTMVGQSFHWIPWDQEAIRATPSGNLSSHVHLALTLHEVKLTSLKAMSSQNQPEVSNVCEDSECEGLCVPFQNATVPLCLCADENEKAVPCVETQKNSKISSTKGKEKPLLEVVNATGFTVTVRYAGPLLRRTASYNVRVAEVASLVSRDSVPKLRTVRVENKHLPITIEGLNPATSYSLTVPNRVTRAAYTMTVHTAPPPLAVKRRPVVTVPGFVSPLKWNGQGVHYSIPNPWENLVTREYFLLLVSKKEFSQSTPVPVKEPIMHEMSKRIKDKFTVLYHYTSEERFDDDPEMYLANIPWGENFWLAMVQVTEYQRVYNLDIIYTEVFSLPDPYWNHLLEEILEDENTPNCL